MSESPVLDIAANLLEEIRELEHERDQNPHRFLDKYRLEQLKRALNDLIIKEYRRTH